MKTGVKQSKLKTKWQKNKKKHKNKIIFLRENNSSHFKIILSRFCIWLKLKFNNKHFEY